MTPLQIPILLITFNRLDTVKKVFETIAQVSPTRLYISSDGPRHGNLDDPDSIHAVRNYLNSSITWDCEVKTLFHSENLGCGIAPAQAITWFFEHEPMGIILEDDCLPSLSFFSYCQDLLHRYENDERIFCISGHNPLGITKTKNNSSYYFTRVPHIWGWATWRRAWEKFSFKINNYDSFKKNKVLSQIFPCWHNVQNFWIDTFDKISKKTDSIDFWDYQWTYANFSNDSICIVPSRNMISNIGFDNNYTHTNDPSSFFNNQERYEINSIIHPKKFYLHKKAMKKINIMSFGIEPLPLYLCKKLVPSFLKPSLKKFKQIFP